MSAYLLRWQIWLHGLIGGFIGGGATAVLASLGMPAAKAAGIDVPDLNLKSLAVIFLSGGLPSAFGYLKKSPLPPLSNKLPEIDSPPLEKN